MRLPYLLAASALAIAGLVSAPAAAADCTEADNQSFCSFGEPGTSGPVLPYDCDTYDYYCNDGYSHWDLF